LALLGVLASVSSSIAVTFSGENRDYFADKTLLLRSYQNWSPLWVPEIKTRSFTDNHSQIVVDSYGYAFHYISHHLSRLVAFVHCEDPNAFSAPR
jgi:hypothetical protein